MRFAISVLCTLVLTACATPGTSSLNYEKPVTANTVTNTAVINDSFDIVWKRLVEGLATSFFVINNLSKPSGLINLSFSTDSPERFINCGTSHRHFAFNGTSRDYDYAVAGDSSYKFAATWGAYNNLPIVYKVYRDTNLEGRINVYLKPLSSNRTEISVNTKYIFTMATSGMATGYNAFGTKQIQKRIPESSSKVSFTTQQVGRKGSPGAKYSKPLVCRATGALEQYILDKARP